ncbi:alpha-(1,3)-fucosyltransferase 4 [Oryzias melastigma]|uniref:Fucosyltransferase n=1 Tax=Oryzias melastigma TaxID=30732 RepID=A0A3B3DID8_ORYME|nr:alpha-(1,3)-fucosyltransferase 4 [Oryzias melastigma]
MGLWARWRATALSVIAPPSAARRTHWPLWRKCCVCVLERTRSPAYLLAVGVVLLLGVCVHLLPEQLAAAQPSPSEEAREVTLLIWTHPFGEYRQLPDCLELYQIRGCTLTDDARAYSLADAVLVHHREVAVGEADLPVEPRPPRQKWIWMNYESPTHTHGLWQLEGVFNLTMSYRTDSDIFLPYGYLAPRGLQGPFAQPLSRSLRTHRRGLVSWVISNWSESHARVAFYYQLRRYIPIDVFGSAGRPIPKGAGSVVQLLRGYKFYLAMENSQHTDYITEKLWNAVAAGAVPVVLGPSRKNYERFLPPDAFIHVQDFPTARHLARYLLMLSRNPAGMKRHLSWRGGYSLHQPTFWDEHYCTACRAVRKRRGQTDEVADLTGWFTS